MILEEVAQLIGTGDILKLNVPVRTNNVDLNVTKAQDVLLGGNRGDLREDGLYRALCENTASLIFSNILLLFSSTSRRNLLVSI